MNTQLPLFYVVSVYNTSRSDVLNESAHNRTLDALLADRIQHKELLGCYTYPDGLRQKEKAILVVDPKGECFETVKQIATLQSQVSFLIVDERRQASEYILATHEHKPLGRWQLVEREVALDQPAYTFDASTGSYYICK